MKKEKFEYNDIIEILKSNELKERDELCDVWSRKKGKSMLERCLKDMEDSGHSYLVVLIDIDGLRDVNDTYGYTEGDFLLQKTVETLKEFVKEPDFIFRLNGDEFVLVLQDMKEKAGKKRVIQWRLAVEEKQKEYEKPYEMSFSYGMSYVNFPNHLQVNDIISKADERMYEEKLRRRRTQLLDENPFRAERLQDGEMEYPSALLYEALTHSTDDYIYICNMKTGVFRYDPAEVKLFGLPGEVIENPLPYWKNIVHPEDWDRFYKSNMEIGENKSDYHSVEFRARNCDGQYLWLKCRGQMVRDEYGNPSLFAGIMTQMGKQNKVDSLTQLLNHKEFIKALDNHTREEMIEQMAVIIVDIDDFRQINELYGRPVGDEILKTIGQTIQSILPDNASLYRLENDKMGILMENAAIYDVEEMYRSIQRYLMKVREWKHQGINIEISAGCAMYPANGKTVEELYQYADYALQHAKALGKNRLELFSEDILHIKLRSMELTRQLRDAISQGYRGFYLNYQPQVDAQTRKMTGVEALMRWTDAEGKVVSPGEFIPIMEEQGMIYETGFWMVRTALHSGKAWLKMNPAFRVSVNVSALQLLEESFLEDLYRIVEEEEFPWKNLTIELTESYTVKNINIFRNKFSEMRSRGIHIAMDDFGTGYSSLEILKNAPVDVVKIDRAFVKDILCSEFDATFISFVVAICHSVNIKVCLEGVETKEEYNFLQNMHLDCIQGYYFGRPAADREISKQLEGD